MSEFIAYTLLLVGMPVFIGMFVGSFVSIPLSKLFSKSPHLQRTHVEVLEAVSGLAAAISAVFLFHLSGLAPNLLVLAVLAVWISVYCFASHRHVAIWLSWLAGLLIGWCALAF
jgi:hypothetical protein